MRLLRAQERVAQPWKNGGGVTREVWVSPERAGFDSFDWRVSLAEVSAAGPFSRFDGIDRTLAILKGRMRLAFRERTVELDEDSAPCFFTGEVSCHGTPLEGPVTDLNLMTRRGKVRARLERGSGEVKTTGTALIVAKEEAALCIGGRTHALGPLDAYMVDGPVTFSLDGIAFIVRID